VQGDGVLTRCAVIATTSSKTKENATEKNSQKARETLKSRAGTTNANDALSIAAVRTTTKTSKLFFEHFLLPSPVVVRLTKPHHCHLNQPKMSDYAKFVAAATRDPAIDALLEENAKLQEKLRASRLMTITGSGGSPIYAQASLDDAEMKENKAPYVGERVKTLKLRNSTGENADSNLQMCQIEDLENAEIRLGDVLLYVCGRHTTSSCQGEEGELFTKHLYTFHGITDDAVDRNRLDSFAELMVEYGPLPETFREEGSEQGPEFHTNDEIAEVRFLDLQLHDLMT